MFCTRLIDWLLLNVQQAVFQIYSEREQVQQYINSDRKEGGTGQSELLTATRKYGDLGWYENVCLCSVSIRLLYTDCFKRCLLRAGSVINYGPRSGFDYYNMKPPNDIVPLSSTWGRTERLCGFHTRKGRSIFHIWCTHLYPIISNKGARVAQWVRSLDLATHTSLSPTRRGFAPGFVNYKKDALDSQPQVIKLTSCLPMVGGSLRVLRLLPPLKLVAMI